MHARPPWGLVFGAATVLGALFAGQVWIDYAYAGHPIAWPRALGIALADWYWWALVTPIVMTLARRFRLDRRTWPRALPLHAVSSIIFAAVALIVGSFVAEAVSGVRRGPFTFLKANVALLTYWAIVGVTYWFEQHQTAITRERRAAELQAELARARLQALRTQLQPHFLFNTLNAIAALMREDVEAADIMISRLSDLLRLALDTADVVEVPLARELEFLRGYLEIQQARIGSRLTVRINVDDEVHAVLVPTLLLQPLVENAIRHGVAARPGPGLVDVSVHVTGIAARPALHITVRDDGPGPPAALRPGHGLENTRGRLHALYGASASLELAPHPDGGALVTVVIPARRESDAEGETAP